VGQPRRLHRYALVVSRDAFEVGRKRAQCTIKTSEPDIDIPGTVHEEPGAVREEPGTVHDEDNGRELEVNKKRTARARGVGAAAPGVSLLQGRTDLEHPEAEDWWNECQRLHRRECNGSLGHRNTMLIEAAKRQRTVDGRQA
jgi:hypothetical protein